MCQMRYTYAHSWTQGSWSIVSEKLRVSGELTELLRQTTGEIKKVYYQQIQERPTQENSEI